MSKKIRENHFRGKRGEVRGGCAKKAIRVREGMRGWCRGKSGVRKGKRVKRSKDRLEEIRLLRMKV